MLVLFIVIGTITVPEIKPSDLNKLLPEPSVDDKDWQTVTDTAELTVGKLSMKLDARNTHFTVTDSASGAVYSSVSASPDEDGKNQSEIIIHYYDANSTLATMNSFKNSAENGNFTVKTDGKAIRVIYSIMKSKIRTFVPAVMTVKTFEETVSDKLQSGKRRRLKLFYTLYEPDGTDSKSKDMKSQYPALGKQPLYILNDSAGDSTFAEITGYMDSAGYTNEMYAKELDKLGMKDDATGNMPAAFTLTLEYKLTEKGFYASVLNDRISEESSGYTLTDFDLLPYFGSVNGACDGWMLVSDGSGAIIDLSEKSGVNYTQSVYGNDAAIEKDRQAAVIQNAGLPVFALNDKSKAFFAMITGSAATASVNAEIYGKEYTGSRIYPSFRCKAVDTSDAGSLRRQGALNLYSKKYVSENPTVFYTLCRGNTTYSNMAAICREKLIADGILGKRTDKRTPLYLDFSGYETIKSSFMGISVDEKIVLSDADGINKALDRLGKSGISGVSVRLKAYGGGGLYSTVQNGLKTEKSVISKKQLNALAKRIKAENGLLYLENSISSVFMPGNGFKKMKTAVRGLKKTVVNGLDYDLVARTDREAYCSYMMTSPVYLRNLTQSFIKSFDTKTGGAELYGYSRSDYGSRLWSDFNESNQIDRCLSADAADDAIKLAADKFSAVMTDGSNSYALKNSGSLLNIPLGSSAFSCESYQIPFYQMTVHGFKSFAGNAINISQDSKKAYLMSVESGADLYFSCYTNSDVSLKETAIGTLIYPTCFDSQLDTIVSACKTFENLFGDLYSQTITEHTCVTDTLRVTTYEHGKQIAVNYGESDAVIGGVTVPAGGFAEVSVKGESR